MVLGSLMGQNRRSNGERERTREMLEDRYNFSGKGQQSAAIIGTRLESFIGGDYAAFNLSSVLEVGRTDSTDAVGIEYWKAGDGWVSVGDAIKAFKEGKGREAKKGEEFGPTCACPLSRCSLSWLWSRNLPIKGHSTDIDPRGELQLVAEGMIKLMLGQTNHWVKLTLTRPSAWSKFDSVILEWDSNCEALIFTESGQALQAFTGGRADDQRREHIISSAEWRKGKVVRYVEVSSYPRGGVNDIDPPTEDRYFKLDSCDLVVPNLEARALQYDFQTLHELSTFLPAQSPLANLARVTANGIMNMFSAADPKSIAICRREAQKVLGQDWEEQLEKARGKEGTDHDGRLWAIGNCHIDTAWLWPWEVTKKKVARSWVTQLELMERYPEYRFLATSAQQYAWLEEFYPDVFKRVQEKAKEGKFEVLGGTWLEHDTNMLSGESFCRQFLLGQGYFKSRFGKTSETFMLPDTFGYSAALPQIARLSGAKQFFTQKISWNLYNQFPYTTFNWVGLDGSQILTHMTPAVNYNSQCHFDDILKGYGNHRNLDVSPDALLLFGHGDGGGGPNADMLERLRRARAVSQENDPKGMEIPKVREGVTMVGLFDEMRKNSDNGKKLPSYWGELYLEAHRGTYTTQARTKKSNRRGEILLREVEKACTLASLTPGGKFTYPHESITRCWEALCLCQFHDTLPGTEIAIVAGDMAKKYAEMAALANRLLEEANAVLYKQNPNADRGQSMFVVNPLTTIARTEIVQYERERPWEKVEDVRWGFDQEEKDLEMITPVQLSEDGKTAAVVVTCDAGSEVGGLSQESFGKVEVFRNKDAWMMRNDNIEIRLEGGRLTSLRDTKLRKELIPKGQSGGFVIYEDQPHYWDAWDVDEFHLEMPEHLSLSSVELQESGPLRASLLCSLEVGKSRGTVKITVDAVPGSVREGSRSLVRFDVDMDWRERHRFLKFELPTTIFSTEATYDAAFGVLKRATHRNTTFEQARFEVPAHKFADLSEYGYGVAIINDCKYGYAVQGNVMRLSLLRSPIKPDPECDQGQQEFSFAIFPHEGSYENSPVQEVAHAFNAPLKIRKAGEATEISPHAVQLPFSIEGARNVLLETIKRGEADAGSKETSVVLRIHEHLGGGARVTLPIKRLNVKKVLLVNILEDEMEELEFTSAKGEVRVELEFKAFEIKTVKVVL